MCALANSATVAHTNIGDFELLNDRDVYGDGASALLAQIWPQLASTAKQVAENFYTALHSKQESASVLVHLSAEEFVRLKQRQAQYLVDLLDPDLSREKQEAIASYAGKAHAMVGVDVLWLIEASHIYESELRRFIHSLSLASGKREQICRVVSGRLQCDLEFQVAVYREIESSVSDAIQRIDEHVFNARNLADLVRGTMGIIGGLPGEPSVLFARADAHGNIQVEATCGEKAERYHQAMESGQIPKFNTNPNLPSGRGPAGESWRTGKIVAADAWALDNTIAPWHPIGMALGFRSSVSVPLVDTAQNTIAMLPAYSQWPGYFSTPRIRGILTHTQHVLEHGIARFSHARVVPFAEQQNYRDLLRRCRVVVLYQPVINLDSGQLGKVECLARLRDEKDKLIAPGEFLPAMGKQELFALFKQVVEQACADSCGLSERGVKPVIAINFPAEGLGDANYEQTLFSTLARYHVPGDRLQLEILETEDTGSHIDQHRAFIKRLRAAGICFAQDDLGSGYSSLLRMDKYDFDEVKIDRGLINHASQKPQRALQFIWHLTQLAHGRDMRVTVEGLEDSEMLEAATILGADYGQGYGIGRPMRMDQVILWNESFRVSVDPLNPQTGLGAEAAALLGRDPERVDPRGELRR